MARLYADEDVDGRIIQRLRLLGHDVARARDVLPSGTLDHRHLMRAVEEDRLLVVHNNDDYLMLYHAWHDWAAFWGASPPSHPAILSVPQLPLMSPTDVASEIHALMLGSASPLRDVFLRLRPRGGWVTDP